MRVITLSQVSWKRSSATAGFAVSLTRYRYNRFWYRARRASNASGSPRRNRTGSLLAPIHCSPSRIHVEDIHTLYGGGGKRTQEREGLNPWPERGDRMLSFR